MLRAYAFALTAVYAVAGFSFALSDYDILPLGAEFGAAFLPVLYSKDIRDRNAHRASGGAVAAACAGYGLIGIKCSLAGLDDLVLVLVQRFEIFHVGEVVFHLLDVAHTAENSEDAFLAADESDRPG